MENNNGIPVPLNEKQAKLMTALADELKQSSHMSMGECMALAGHLTERVVKEGWQWHPVATEWNLDYNMVALPEHKDPTPEEEIEFIDRIISGLPARVVGFKASQWPDSIPTDVKIVDVASLHPQEVNMWKRIPEYDNYEVNPLGVIRSRWTRRVLEVIEQGGEEYVDMHDKDGYEHTINVRYIKENVFGK